MPDLNLALLAALVPAGAFAFAVYQYSVNSQNAQRQRAREQAIQAADEMEAFRDDAAAALAMTIVDYADVLIEVGGDPPQKTRLTLGIVYDALEVHTDRALRLGRQPGDSVEKAELFNATERAVRGAFDGLLVRLERIEALIRAGVIGKAQFGDLFSYWLKLLAEQPRPEDMNLDHFGDRRRERLWRYIRKYEFNGVVRLFQLYGRAGSLGADPQQAFRLRPRPTAPDSTSTR